MDVYILCIYCVYTVYIYTDGPRKWSRSPEVRVLFFMPLVFLPFACFVVFPRFLSKSFLLPPLSRFSPFRRFIINRSDISYVTDTILHFFKLSFTISCLYQLSISVVYIYCLYQLPISIENTNEREGFEKREDQTNKEHWRIFFKLLKKILTPHSFPLVITASHIWSIFHISYFIFPFILKIPKCSPETFQGLQHLKHRTDKRKFCLSSNER